MDYVIIFVIIFIIILLMIQSSRRVLGTTSEYRPLVRGTPSFEPKMIQPSNDSKRMIKASSKKANKVYDLSLASSVLSSVTCDPNSTVSSLSAVQKGKDYYYVGDPKESQVYHIYNNVYTYKEAGEECAKRASQLADPNELQNAYSQGADWCSWGWANDGNAYLPNKNKDCNSQIGLLNGKNIDPYLRMGINCYGVPK
jgi:hypothetical protein